MKKHPNVVKMKILGARLILVTRGTATLKDAVDSAFEEYLKDPKNFIYAIGSVVRAHPFPKWYVISNRLLAMKLKFKLKIVSVLHLIILWRVLVVVQMQ